ncbi:DUF6226 family protein [Mycobacterium genavense]|uniref:DUF6226 family protein n=1 Tax=Mycobacterium genavense TaxID=36812 RepID=UPI0012EB8CE7|nr:DUF6226 family protein [Mycobacterium genavense]
MTASHGRVHPPALQIPDFRDESGTVIRYGSRWTGSPPDDAYSRVSNPARFAPLWNIAEALIEHLQTAYRVDIASLTESTPGTTKLIAVTSQRADAARLLFRFTDFPGVEIAAGVGYRAAFPSCGCDACDETCEGVAEAMEVLVFAVAGGRFTEHITAGPTGKASMRFRVESTSGAVQSGAIPDWEPAPAVRADAARLARLPGGVWQPWATR